MYVCIWHDLIWHTPLLELGSSVHGYVSVLLIECELGMKEKVEWTHSSR
jgi:hypothetical protein